MHRILQVMLQHTEHYMYPVDSVRVDKAEFSLRLALIVKYDSDCVFVCF